MYPKFLAGSAEAILCPLERVQVLLQSAHYHERFYNTGHALKEVSKVIYLYFLFILRSFYIFFSGKIFTILFLVYILLHIVIVISSFYSNF